MLNGYAALPKYEDEVPINTGVMLVFTIARYPYKGPFRKINYAISLNIQQIIVLASPTDGSGTEEDEAVVGSPKGVHPVDDSDIEVGVPGEGPVV